MSAQLRQPAPADVESRVFVFCGEGAHSADTDLDMLKFSPSWPAVQQALRDVGHADPEVFLQANLGVHSAPNSPVLSVAVGILNADLWKQWGQTPSVVLGHSVGEIAAAYTAGMLTIGQAIGIAHGMGVAMQNLAGFMLHAELPRSGLTSLPTGVHLASVNYVVKRGDCKEKDLLSVTLCGLGSAEDCLAEHPGAKVLQPQHAWHHPEAPLPATDLPRGQASSIAFISSVTGTQLHELSQDHWRRWLRSPVNFAEALQVAAGHARRCAVLEMGPHPVFHAAIQASFGDELMAYASSMHRGEKAAPWLRSQRGQLPGFRARLAQGLRALRVPGVPGAPELCPVTRFAEQGFSSQQLVPLAQRLAGFFPGLAVHDLYRFTSLEKLQDWDGEVSLGRMPGTAGTAGTAGVDQLEILGCGVRLPAGIHSPGALWTLLLDDDRHAAFAAKDGVKAAFLQPKFDGQAAMAAAEAAGVEGAEAAAMDPQHAFALQLAQEMWEDAGSEAAQAAKARLDHVGVYIGAWQPAVSNARASAYHTIGTSLSALAARVANAHDLQGPVMTLNTACSSALVAVHEALRDARAGRIDFAIAGGVNLFGDDLQLFTNLRRAGMLSPSGRCHTFSADADGYVRAEGGALFLLHTSDSKDSKMPSRCRILGSAVTQNSKQKPLSSVDPAAQERAIRLACQDAGVRPAELAAVELHGTGTPLGDPVEVSALAKAVGHAPCVMTAVKMHLGHLESAAGAVGLMKAMLMCQHRQVLGFSIDGKGLNPQVIAAMEGSCLPTPGKQASLTEDSVLGVSSFGFAGSNAHIIVAPTPAHHAYPKYEGGGRHETVPTRPPSALSLAETVSTASPRSQRSQEPAKCPSTHASRLFSVAEDGDLPGEVDINVNSLTFVGSAVLSIVGGDAEVDVDADLHELGVDSLGLAELLGLLEDKFGRGCITIDKIMDEPSCRAIATNLECGSARPLPPSVSTPAPKRLPAKSVTIVLPNTVPETVLTQPSVKSPSPSKPWIRTTHVGSLPRPAGQLHLAEVIVQQAGCVDVINDGEWGRDNYIADVISRIPNLRGTAGAAGCCAKHAMPVAADMHDVPIYAQRFTGGNGLITLNPKREAVSDLACVAHPKYEEAEIPSLRPFLEAVAKAEKDAADCFYSVPSPGTMALFCQDAYFHDHKAYVMALAEALAPEYRQVARTGLQLQVDCPDLAMGRHTRWSEMTDSEFLDIARCNVEALNIALKDVPLEQIRIHVCWGNYAGPHHKDMPAGLLWPILAEAKATYLLVEGANARHRMDVLAFEEAVKKGHFKEHQVIVPGLIDTTAARVEDPRLIAETLLRYVRAAGHPARVMAGTDCGFASTAKSTAITSDLAWLKLRSLADGADLATRCFIEQRAPVPCRTPAFAPTPFRAVIFAAASDQVDYVAELRQAFDGLTMHSTLVFSADAFAELRWVVDVPLALVALGSEGLALAQRTLQQLEEDKAVARRPAKLMSFDDPRSMPSTAEVASAVRAEALGRTGFDKRSLVLPRLGSPPASVDVVVVGAGLLGMLTAHRCRSAGFSVAVLEQRALVGGIWSMYANATSQVNSSEGGYCIKELIGEDDGKAAWDNRDHSTAAEVLTDFAKLGDKLKDHIFTSVKVVKVLGERGNYTVLFEDAVSQSAGIAQCRGVVLCINDRVGLPRPLDAPGRSDFAGVVADGTSDSLAGVAWRGKRVVIAGMGAFAVENVRTALEHGAAQVTVVGRRHGTICPKAIDYLNFVKPWDAKYKHDTQTNVKQFLRWKQLYEASGCIVPECWPKQVKHDGHTISVSDIWFIAHFMNKLRSNTGEIKCVETDGVVLSSGDFIACDIVVGCIGFERSSFLCESLTGRSEVKTTNYLDKDMMYLADAEIDEGAFNSFFGSSVLEYGKFFSNVFVEGLQRPELGEQLWGVDIPAVPITQRKWNQYIAAAMKLIETDQQIAEHARHQVDRRTAHFWRTLPPGSFLEVNRRDWEELHHRLNGGVPVPKEQQLPYFFDEIPEWCSDSQA
ncbi:unnamed protein product [Effrenium voratum]|nr:unnamed protein product [Effrenium voratum]